MENPYEGQNYRPYTPPPVYEPESAPNSSVYQGNATFATLSLVMGILSILSICCFFPYGFCLFGAGHSFFLSVQRRTQTSRKCKGGYGYLRKLPDDFYCSGNIYMHLFPGLR